jgi:hypothetical protein
VLKISGCATGKARSKASTQKLLSKLMETLHAST